MATKTSEQKRNVGKVVQVIGPVLDVEFEPEQLPELGTQRIALERSWQRSPVNKSTASARSCR